MADGAYFGINVSGIIKPLVRHRMDGKGWNYERERELIWSSFTSTVSVLEGLLEHEKATGRGTAKSVVARKAERSISSGVTSFVD